MLRKSNSSAPALHSQRLYDTARLYPGLSRFQWWIRSTNSALLLASDLPKAEIELLVDILRILCRHLDPLYWHLDGKKHWIDRNLLATKRT